MPKLKRTFETCGVSFAKSPILRKLINLTTLLSFFSNNVVVKVVVIYSFLSYTRYHIINSLIGTMTLLKYV